MIEAKNEPRQEEREAAEWFTRMLNSPVENEALAAFEIWRRNPDNLAAYNRMEDISRLALSLQDDPDLRAIAQSARKRRKPPAAWYAKIFKGSRQRWAVGIAIGGLVAASAVVWKMTAPTYETTVGRQIVAQLPDGTRVRLNTDTALTVRFKNGVRRVVLARGQAFFDVAHDPSHPFIVVSGDTEVRAIGTRFDVRREHGGAKVVLAQGRVAITERGERPSSWTLVPGQTVTTGTNGAAQVPLSTDIAVATGWTQGRLSFRATPIEEAVSEVNRYSRDKIILSANVPSDKRINGDFAIGKPGEFVTAMTTLYGLKSERRLGGDIELRSGAD